MKRPLMENLKFRIKLQDGKKAGEYFVAGDYKGYTTTTNKLEASAFMVMDLWGNMAALLDMCGVHGMPELVEPAEPVNVEKNEKSEVNRQLEEM